MGNLLNLKNIRLNKEKKLLKEQLDIFGKRYPKLKEIISQFLIWDESNRKTFANVLITHTHASSIGGLVLKKRKRKRKTQPKRKAFDFISEEEDIQVKWME